MSDETEAFVERVLGALPALRPQYEATAAECRVEGLEEATPELFLFEYTQALLAGYRSDPTSARQGLAELAQVLEREYGVDPEVDGVIEAGFLVLLPATGEGPDPAQLLGPKLAAVLGVERDWRASPAHTEFVRRLLAAVPALEPLARENVYGDHDDVLIHPFLSDLVRREVDNVQNDRLEEVRAVINMIEAECGGDVDEPIAASFVEALPYPDEPGAQLVDLLGPRLRDVLDGQRTPPR